MFCYKCGAKFDEKLKNCPKCGENIKEELYELDRNAGEENIKKKIPFNQLSVYCSVLWFYSVLTVKQADKDKNYSFHMSQGFTLLLVEILSLGFLFIPLFGKFIFLLPVAGCIYLSLTGIKNFKEDRKEKLPVIGDFIIIKPEKKKKKSKK